MSIQYPTAKQFFYTVTGSFDGTTLNPSFGIADYIVHGTVGNLGVLDPDRSPQNLEVPVEAARYHTYVSLLILELDAGVTVAGSIDVVDVYTGVTVQTVTALAPGQSSYQNRTGFILYPGTVLKVTADKPGKLRVDQLIPDDATTLAFMQSGGGGSITEIVASDYAAVQSGTGPVVTVSTNYPFSAISTFTVQLAPSFGLVNLYDTSDGAYTITLPAGVEGQPIIIKDTGNTFATNALTVQGQPGVDVESVLTGAPVSSTDLTVGAAAYKFAFDSTSNVWRII